MDVIFMILILHTYVVHADSHPACRQPCLIVAQSRLPVSADPQTLKTPETWCRHWLLRVTTCLDITLTITLSITHYPQ